MHRQRDERADVRRAARVIALATCFGACGSSDRAERLMGPTVRDDAGAFSTRVLVPASLTGLRSGATDVNGAPLDVPCATCHRGRVFALPTGAASVGGPHAGLRFSHGNNTCGACHDPTNAEQLRLADGRTVPLEGAMNLCAQCHGPQARDYAHGAHGGMNGHWDLRRGPRVRNHCAHCHDPHEPAFPSFVPMPAPLDAPHVEHAHTASRRGPHE